MAGEVRRFRPVDPELKVPHMGWNAVRVVRSHPVLADIEAGDEFYFVHAYRPVPANVNAVLAESVYGVPFCSALGACELRGHAIPPGKRAAEWGCDCSNGSRLGTGFARTVER